MGAEDVAAHSPDCPQIIVTTLAAPELDISATQTIGFGCAGIGGYDYGAVNDLVSIAAIERALDRGVSVFDTADVYGLGHAETMLSRGLGTRRHDVLICTKVGVSWDENGRTSRNLRPEYLEQALHASLGRLRLDSIPLYQVHWPDPDTPVETTLETLDKFRRQGKIQRIGCCNVDIAWVERAQKVCRVDTLQVPFSLIQREWLQTLRDCRDLYSMATTVYNVLAQGLLTGKFGARARFEASDLRSRSTLFQGDVHERGLRVLAALTDIARKRGVTPAQVALRWTMPQPEVNVTLAGMKTPQQADDNAGAFNCVLTQDEINCLSEL
jgi:aryl-alcohol dehydrogenase-like predicted oxidoreductase